MDPSDYNLNCTFTGIFDIDDCLIYFILLEGYCFSKHSTHTHTCWKWKSTNYHKWLNRTCPCFGTIDFLRKSIAKLIPPRFFPLRYVRWWPLPPTNHLVALTTNSRVSLSENSGDGGPPREAATSPSDGHLVDEDPEDDEDVSPDKDIGRSSEEQLKVACKKKRKKENVILQSWSLRY